MKNPSSVLLSLSVSAAAALLISSLPANAKMASMPRLPDSICHGTEGNELPECLQSDVTGNALYSAPVTRARVYRHGFCYYHPRHPFCRR